MGSAAAHIANTRPDATLVALGGVARAEVCQVLRARGLQCDPHETLPALERAAKDGAIVAYFCDREQANAGALASLAITAQATGNPLIVCLPRIAPGGEKSPSATASDRALERMAGATFLAAKGAIVCDDPDVWTEVIALCAWYGMPGGGNIALVSAPGSWMERVASAVVAELGAAGRRLQLQLLPTKSTGPTHLLLVDETDTSALSSRHPSGALIVPVAARPETSPPNSRALRGVRTSMFAALCCGQAAERRASQQGAPAPAVDEERFARARMALTDRHAKLGDHETKVFLAAFGVPVTRQAIASTPSAALRIAKTIGFPVEMKRWGVDAPPESKGALVERNLQSAADVRRAFLSVMKGATGDDAGGDESEGAIVRAGVAQGRNARLRFLPLGALGWSMVLEFGAGRPPEIVPIPLAPKDAEHLAGLVAGTRAGEPSLDQKGFADIMLRASHLAYQLGSEISELVLDRVVIAEAPATAIVADAYVLRSVR